MDWLTRIADVIKVVAKYVVVFFLVSGCLLLLPEPWVAKLRLESLPENYGFLIGLVFLFSGALLLTNAGRWVCRCITAYQRREKWLAGLRARCETLDHQEQSVLREFSLQGQHTIKLPFDHPVVAGLIHKRILQVVGRLAEQSVAGALLPVRITDEAQAVLTPALIELPERKPSEEEMRRLKSARPEFAREIEAHDELYHRSW